MAIGDPLAARGLVPTERPQPSSVLAVRRGAARERCTPRERNRRCARFEDRVKSWSDKSRSDKSRSDKSRSDKSRSDKSRGDEPRGGGARIWAIAPLVAALSWLLPGCPRTADTTPTFATTTSDVEAEREFRAAEAAFEAGQPRTAELLLVRFRARRPDDPLAAVAALLLGRISLEREDIPGARRLFAVAARAPDEVLRDRARFYDAVARQRGGDSRGAVRLLAPLVERTTDPDEAMLLLRTLAEAYESLGQRVQALRYWDRLASSSVPDDELATLRAGIVGLVDSLPPEELALALDRLPPAGFAWPVAARRAVRRAYEAADLARTRALVDRVERAGLPLDEELRQLRSQAARREQVQPFAIGAVLPLTGSDRARGQEALHALMVAAGIPLTSPPGPETFRLAVRDDRGEPARAGEAVDELVREERVIGIVAGVAGETARAAAARAQALGVPCVLLSDDADATSAGAFVLRAFPTAHAELAALTRHAAALGIAHLVLLRPLGPEGDAIAAEARALAAGGVEIAADVAFGPDAGGPARAVRSVRASSFDGILVVADAQTSGRWGPALAAAFATRERPRALLFATARWEPAAVGALVRQVPDAIVTLVHTPTPGAAGAVAELATGWGAQWPGEPGVLAAFAFDAFRCLRDVVLAGARTRADALSRLLGTRFPDGATPGRAFDARRELSPAVRLHHAVDGVLRPLGD